MLAKKSFKSSALWNLFRRKGGGDSKLKGTKRNCIGSNKFPSCYPFSLIMSRLMLMGKRVPAAEPSLADKKRPPTETAQNTKWKRISLAYWLFFRLLPCQVGGFGFESWVFVKRKSLITLLLAYCYYYCCCCWLVQYVRLVVALQDVNVAAACYTFLTRLERKKMSMTFGWWWKSAF